jgi:hypothetical protein
LGRSLANSPGVPGIADIPRKHFPLLRPATDDCGVETTFAGLCILVDVWREERAVIRWQTFVFFR